MSSALIADARLGAAAGLDPARWRDPADSPEDKKPDLAWCREMERLQATAWFPGCLPGRAGAEGGGPEPQLRRALDATPAPVERSWASQDSTGPTNYALRRYVAQGASERAPVRGGAAPPVPQNDVSVEEPVQARPQPEPITAGVAAASADLSAPAQQPEVVRQTLGVVHSVMSSAPAYFGPS